MYTPKPSLRDYVSIALLGVAPLVGCGKEPVNPSMLENKVANAQTINGADVKGGELDLSTKEIDPVKYVLERLVDAINSRDYHAFRELHSFSDETELRQEFNESVKELTKRGQGSYFLLGEIHSRDKSTKDPTIKVGFKMLINYADVRKE